MRNNNFNENFDTLYSNLTTCYITITTICKIKIIICKLIMIYIYNEINKKTTWFM